MLLQDLNPRAQTILRLVIDNYVASGEAVGSRTLSQNLARILGLELSPATIRNAMADLEEAGLLTATHTSAGRMPTDAGLRLFVNTLLEVNPVDAVMAREMTQSLDGDQQDFSATLERASMALSGLAQCAGLVAATKKDRPLRQVEFVTLGPGKALVVWVGIDGSVENRLIDIDPRLTPSDLQQASNYLTHHLSGRDWHQARKAILEDISQRRTALDTLTQQLITQGLVLPTLDGGLVIVRGQSHLLNDVREIGELDRLRKLFDTLEQRETMLRLVDQAGQADGVQIFIGAQSDLFNHSGCAMIVAPYKDKQQKMVGAIGVIGPSRLNYGRIIPMVDFTAQLLSGVTI